MLQHEGSLLPRGARAEVQDLGVHPGPAFRPEPGHLGHRRDETPQMLGKQQ